MIKKINDYNGITRFPCIKLESVDQTINDLINLIPATTIRYESERNKIYEHEFMLKDCAYKGYIDHELHGIDIQYKPHAMYFVVNCDVGLVDQPNRLKYRRSKYFNKLLKFDDIVGVTDIFNRIPVLTHVGRGYMDFRVLCLEDRTYIIMAFDYDTSDVNFIDKLYFKLGMESHNVSKVIFMPNGPAFKADVKQITHTSTSNGIQLSVDNIKLYNNTVVNNEDFENGLVIYNYDGNPYSCGSMYHGKYSNNKVTIGCDSSGIPHTDTDIGKEFFEIDKMHINKPVVYFLASQIRNVQYIDNDQVYGHNFVVTSIRKEDGFTKVPYIVYENILMTQQHITPSKFIRFSRMYEFQSRHTLYPNGLEITGQSNIPQGCPVVVMVNTSPEYHNHPDKWIKNQLAPLQQLMYDKKGLFNNKRFNRISDLPNMLKPSEMPNHAELNKVIKDIHDFNNTILTQKDSPRKYLAKDVMNNEFMVDEKLKLLQKIIDHFDSDSIRLYFYNRAMEEENRFRLDKYNTASELARRLRNNTSREVSQGVPDIIFPIPHYLFIFNREALSMETVTIKLYIDGTSVWLDHSYEVKDKLYVYIPYTHIDSDSTVEVEVIRDLTSQDGGGLNFNALRDSELINFDKYLNSIIRLNDVYYSRMDGGTLKKRMLYEKETFTEDKMLMFSNLIYETPEELMEHKGFVNGGINFYTINAAIPFEKVYNKSSYGKEADRMPEKYFSISDCNVVPREYIKPLTARGGYEYNATTDNLVDPVNLIHPSYPSLIPGYEADKATMFIYKKFTYDTFKVLTEENKTDIWKTVIDPDFYREERVRVYKNGRLLPKSKYRFTKENDKLMFVPLMERFIGDVFIVEQISFDYNEIYVKMGKITQPAINGIEYDKVVVDRDVLHRPLDLQWYDIYVNGRKLTDKDIVIKGYNTFRLNPKTIRNLNNLYIYQREVYDYRTVFENKSNITDIIVNEDGFVKEEYNKIDDYTIDEPDIMTNPINPSDFLDKDFYKRKLTYSFINPDLEQIDQEVIDNYAALLDSNYNFLIDPDKGNKNAKVMPINPDKA